MIIPYPGPVSIDMIAPMSRGVIWPMQGLVVVVVMARTARRKEHLHSNGDEHGNHGHQARHRGVPLVPKRR